MPKNFIEFPTVVRIITKSLRSLPSKLLKLFKESLASTNALSLIEFSLLYCPLPYIYHIFGLQILSCLLKQHLPIPPSI